MGLKLSYTLNRYFLPYAFIWAFMALCGKADAQELGQFEITAVNFSGNNNISTALLENAVNTKESPNWVSKFLNTFTSFGSPPKYIDTTLIANDLELLRNFYFDNGFFKVRIDPELQYNYDEKTVSLHFKITENEAAKYRKFQLKGLDHIEQYLQGKIKQDYAPYDNDDRFNRNYVEKKIQNIISFLRDHGFMLISNQNPDVVIDTLLNKVDITVNFNAGRRFRIDSVRVFKSGIGKDLVTEELIKDIAGLKPGNYYSYYDSKLAQIRLYRTDLFSSVVVNGAIADTNLNKVPMNISAEVGMLNEISPELIFNNEDNTLNAGAGVGFTRKNFLGDARRMTLSFSGALQNVYEFITETVADSNLFGYIDSRLVFDQPFLFGKPIATKLEGYGTFQKRKSEYNAFIYGSQISLDFELPRQTFFNSFLAYIRSERTNYDYQDKYITEGLSEFLQNQSGLTAAEADSTANYLVSNNLVAKSTKATNAVIGFRLGNNHTDNLAFPTSGTALSINLESGNALVKLGNVLGIIDADVPQYVKLLLNFSAYLPVYSTRNASLGFKSKIGNIFTYEGDEALIPINQRFYGGGSNSIRGWKTRDLVPEFDLNKVSPDDVFNVIKGLEPGGFFILEVSVESRNKLTDDIGVTFFADAGNTWDSYKKVQPQGIAIAAGFGLRYYLDFAPFRLDFGFKVYDPTDRRSFFKKKVFGETLEFHLGIGEAF